MILLILLVNAQTMLTTVVLKEFKSVMTTANYILCPLNGGETHQERDPPGGRPPRRVELEKNG